MKKYASMLYWTLPTLKGQTYTFTVNVENIANIVWEYFELITFTQRYNIGEYINKTSSNTS